MEKCTERKVVWKIRNKLLIKTKICLSLGQYFRVCYKLYLSSLSQTHSLAGPTPAQTRISDSRLLRAISRWVLSISKDGESTTLLGSWYQYLTALRFKKKKKVQMKYCAFHFVPIASCPVLGHNWEKSSSLFISPIKCLHTTIRSLWAISSLGWAIPIISASPYTSDALVLWTGQIPVCLSH